MERDITQIVKETPLTFFFFFFLFLRATYVRVVCHVKKNHLAREMTLRQTFRKGEKQRKEKNVTRFSHDKRTRECLSLDSSRSNDH